MKSLVFAGAALALANSATAGVPDNFPNIIDLPAQDSIELDMSTQSKVLQCAAEAISALPIPDASVSIRNEEYKGIDISSGKEYSSSEYIVQKDKMSAFKIGEGHSITLNYEKPNAVELPGYDLNTIFARITLNPDQTQVSFKAFHPGSYNATVDDSTAIIAANIKDGKLVDRQGTAVQHKWETNAVTKTAEGQWVIAAAQTLEANFAKCAGLESSERPVNAATKVFQPPYPQGVPAASVRGLGY